MLEENKNGGGGGGGVRVEDWNTSILSSLFPDEFNTILATDLIDQWSQLGVNDPLKTLKRLQVPFDDQGRLCVNDVRHAIDTGLREFVPIGPMALAAYKSEVVYLTEVINQTRAEMQNYREQCQNHEKRIESLIIDADDRQSNLIDEYTTEMVKCEKQAKEKYEKMYESKKDEIDFLQTTVSQLNTTLDESQKKNAEKELHFRRRVDENLAEIGDLRGQLAELKTTLEEGTTPVLSQSASTKSEDSKSAFDFDTSMLVDEYEKCMRDMQDKIDEQNMTINSLIDQMDTRVAPDGEESKEDVDDEGQELAIHFDALTSTPNHKSSMADEIRSNGMIPKRLGQLLSDQQDQPSQTDPPNQNHQSSQCNLRNKHLEDQVQELMKQIKFQEQKIANLESEMKSRENLIEQKAQELIELKLQNEVFKTDLDKQVIDRENLVEQKNEELKDLKQKNEVLDIRLEEKTSTLEEIQSQLNQQITNLESVVTQKNNEINEAKVKCIQQDKLAVELSTENAELTKRIKSLEVDQTLQNELNEQIQKLENQADQLERRHVTNTTQLEAKLEGEKQKFISDLKEYFTLDELSTNADMSCVFKCLQSCLIHKVQNKENLAQLSAEVDKLQTEIGRSKKLLRQKDTQIDTLKKQPDLKEANAKLENELKKYRLKLKTFEGQLFKLNKVEIEHQRELNAQKREFIEKVENLNRDKKYLEEQLRQKDEQKEREAKIEAALATGLVTKVITEEITETTTTQRLPRGNTQYLEVAYDDSEEEKSSGDDCRLSYKLKSSSQDSGFDDQPQPQQNGDSWNGRIVYAKDSNSLKYMDNTDISSMRASLGLTPTRQANQNKNNNHVTNYVSPEMSRLRHENEKMTDKLAKMRIELSENTTRMRNLYQKLSKSELLLKDLYMENTRLMKVIRSHFAGSLPSV